MTEEISFLSLFKDLQVQVLECPFKLKPLEKPKVEIIQENEKNLKFDFPKEYVEYCSQIGGGHLGHIQIFMPLEYHGHPHSLFFHTRKHQNHIANKYKNKLDTQFEEIIIFAQDTVKYIYFGWKKGKNDVYSFHQSGDINKISSSFLSFVKEYCLGDNLEELLNENLEEEDEEEVKLEPKLEFVPFPSMNQNQ